MFWSIVAKKGIEMFKSKVREWLFRHARRSSWRIGRWLYSSARGQTANNMAANGEAFLQKMVVNAVQPEDRLITVCDVGANLGDWSQMMLDTASSREVAIELFAFEPIPATSDRFNARFKGRRPAPRLQRMALSDSTGEAEMAVFSETGGTNSLVFRDGEEIGPRVTVTLKTFDTWAAENGIEQVDLMKIDTEGHDFAVLKGCAESLRGRKIKVVQFEYNHRWIAARAYLRDVFELAQPFGYHVGQIRPDGIEIYDRWHFELEHFAETNCVLVHEACLSQLTYWRGDFNSSNIFVPKP